MRISNYSVENRLINFVEVSNITGNENVDKFHFNFDSEWDNFTAKFLVLIVGTTTYIDQLDNEDNVVLRSVAYDRNDVKFGIYGIYDTSKLSTDVVWLETIPSAWGQIVDVDDIPDKNVWQTYTEEMLALLAQGQITLEQCEQALNDTETARDAAQGYMNDAEAYKNTTKGYMDTTEGYKNDTNQLKQDTQGIVDTFNSNVQQKTTDFNNNAASKTNAFDQNASDKTGTFNQNVTNKTNTFDQNASDKTTAYNNNHDSKIGTYNDNATNKTNAFDGNATDKTTDFNTNASNKTGDFNSNATGKTTDFNTNYVNKLNDFNENAQAYADFDQKVLDSWVKGTPEESSIIYLDDSSSFNFKEFVPKGKTYQVTSTGKNLMPLTNQDFSISGTSFHIVDGSLLARGINSLIISEDNSKFKTNLKVTLPQGTYTLSWANRTGIRCYICTIEDVQLLNLRTCGFIRHIYFGGRDAVLCHILC